MSILAIWVLPVFVFILFAVRQRSQKTLSVDSSTQAIQIHKDRLKALADQFQRGELSEDEYESFKTEEEKSLLADTELSRQHTEQPSKMPWLWVPVLTVITLAMGWQTYLAVGASDAVKVSEQFKQLSTASDFNPSLVSDTLASYQALLKQNPDDVEGWFRLSRMQMDMEQFEGAISSLQHVLSEIRKVEHNSEDEAAVLSYIGQSYVSLAQPDLALAAFEESLQYNQTPTALGLAGKMSFDMGNYQLAIDYWTRLKLANPSSDTSIIDQFINQAKDQLTAQGIDYEAELPTRVIVSVNLPAAYEGLANSAALFVYARPVGQRMPLAVKRLPINSQSMTVMLSDADAMGPMGGISSQERVEITARVSLTGIANTQPGDWEGNSVELALEQKESFVEINIQQP